MEFYILLLFFLAFMLISIVITIKKKLNVPGIKPFFACVLLVQVWSITYAFELLNSTLNDKVLWFVIRMAFIVYIPTFLLMVTLEITNKYKLENCKSWLLFISPTITAILAITFYYNKLFIYNYYMDYSSGYGVLRFNKGFWFWINAAYNYLLNTINIGILLRCAFVKQYTLRKQAITIIIGMIIPIISDVMLVGRVGINKYLDFTPISLFFSVLVCAHGMYKYGFMNIVPIAREYAFEDMNELMVVLDVNGKVVDMNRKALEMFKTSISKVIGKPVEQIISDLGKYDFCNCNSSSLKIRLNNEVLGKEFYYYGSISVIKANVYEVLGYLLLFQDITELTNIQRELSDANEQLRLLNEELYNESIKDGLTEIYNKKYITMLLQQEFNCAIKSGKPLSISLVDIDYFKNVNDNYGHLVGDNVLKEIAELISIKLEDRGVVGRFGGEEFLILMMNTELKAASKLCEEIRMTVCNYRFQYQQLTVTVSAGISQLKLEDNINSLIKRTDDYLYMAKINGRNRVEYGKGTDGT